MTKICFKIRIFVMKLIHIMTIKSEKFAQNKAIGLLPRELQGS